MYEAEIRMVKALPRQLEVLYHTALKKGQDAEFTRALETCFTEEPENNVLEAWHYRLAHGSESAREVHITDWRLAIPLALLSGGVLGLVTVMTNQHQNSSDFMLTLRIWSLVTLVFILVYLKVKNPEYWKLSAICLAVSAAVIGWSMVAGNRLDIFGLFTEQLHYSDLVIFSVPILAWAVTGLSLLGWHSSVQDRFAFLRKSLEVFVAGGIFGAGLFLFAMVAFQLFNAIDVTIPTWLQDFMIGFIIGAVPVIAVAFIYNPLVKPAEQMADRGIGKMIVTLMRVLLPVTFFVLVIYIGFIPFNFWKPFENRDVLTIYNVMLFAVVALLIGSTPITLEELPEKVLWMLRWAIIGVAALVVAVSIYAISAVIYRTVDGGLTINRLTIIGWNVINIVILALLVIKQLLKPRLWIEAVQQAFSVGMILYPAWALFILVLGPALF